MFGRSAEESCVDLLNDLLAEGVTKTSPNDFKDRLRALVYGWKLLRTRVEKCVSPTGRAGGVEVAGSNPVAPTIFQTSLLGFRSQSFHWDADVELQANFPVTELTEA